MSTSRSPSPVRNGRRSRSRSRSRSKDSQRKRSRSRSRTPPRRSRSRSYGGGGGVYRVHIADIGSDVSERKLEDIFGKFGPLREVWVARYPPWFAFAVYKSQRDAEDAVYEMNGQYIGSSRARVTIARPRRGPGGPMLPSRRFSPPPPPRRRARRSRSRSRSRRRSRSRSGSRRRHSSSRSRSRSRGRRRR